MREDLGLRKIPGKEERESSKFFSSVFILSVSTIAVKIIGMLYKIPMLSLLGAEGMGYFNSAYEIYAVLCVVVTTGLPTALSILVSSYRQSDGNKKIIRLFNEALVVFLVLGVSGTVLLFCGADTLSDFIENKGAAFCFLAISPAVLFVCISSAVRGYFQGLSKMIPTAISQLIEAVGKLILGLLFALMAIKKGYEVELVAAYAAWGFSVGMLVSTLYLCITKMINSMVMKKEAQKVHFEKVLNKEKTFLSLIKIAFPITLSAVVISITKIIDMTFIMRRMQDIGYASGVVNEMFGIYSTVAVPIFNLVPSLLAPISLALIPELSASVEKKNSFLQKHIVKTSLRYTVLFALPATFAIVLYSGPIISILFPGAEDNYEYVVSLLSVLGASILFSCLITTTNAILQSFRKTVKPIFSMLSGVAVKIISGYFLIGIPSVNIYGAPISTLLCDLVIVAINMTAIDRELNGECNMIPVYFKSMMASLVSIALSFAVYYPMLIVVDNEGAALLTAIPVAIVAYFAVSYFLKIITVEDLNMMPGGKKIKSILQKSVYKKEN